VEKKKLNTDTTSDIDARIQSVKLIGRVNNMKQRYYSDYFKSYFTVTRFISDTEWWFKLEGKDEEMKAQTSLSYFMNNETSEDKLRTDAYIDSKEVK
jgi:hypothetical protein